MDGPSAAAAFAAGFSVALRSVDCRRGREGGRGTNWQCSASDRQRRASRCAVRVACSRGLGSTDSTRKQAFCLLLIAGARRLGQRQQPSRGPWASQSPRTFTSAPAATRRGMDDRSVDSG